MSEQSLQQAALAAAPVALSLRRILFLALVGLTMAAMIGLLVVALSAGGFGFVDFVLVVLFAITLPWMVIGFWNATIGFLVMRLARDPVATVTPTAAGITGREPITASTAVLICIRNEPPERPAAFLMPLLQGLAAIEGLSVSLRM
jgi:membrane glycosyltransferase